MQLCVMQTSSKDDAVRVIQSQKKRGLEGDRKRASLATRHRTCWGRLRAVNESGRWLV